MNIRRATREDCPAMMELIRELAVFEKAPNEVTVDPKHFEESGFGDKPVWWAFVAVAEKSEERKVISETENQENGETDKIPLLPRQMPQRGIVSGIGGVDHTSEASMGRGGSPPSTTSTPSTIVAFALYYIRYSTWKGQAMYLEDLIVTEKMRGKGIGSKLIQRLVEEAKVKGFNRIAWQVLDWNEPAINFYKKLGAKFDPEWVNVVLEVE